MADQTTCLFYAHDDPALRVDVGAEGGMSTAAGGNAPSGASGAASMAYKDIAGVKVMDVHCTKPLVACGDEVPRLPCTDPLAS